MTKTTKELILGGVFFLLGIGFFLANINVGNLHFYMFGRVSSAPILVILLIVFIVLAIVKTKWYTVGLIFLDILLIIFSVIMGTNFTFKRMSALTLVLMVLVLSVGLGLIMKALMDREKKG